jgi:hypothetical protein
VRRALWLHDDARMSFLRKRRGFSRRCRLVIACLWQMAALIFCQETPPLPPDGIHDDGRVLPDAVRAEISRQIGEFRIATGCDFFLATTSYLGGTNVRDHANTLGDAWLGERPGLLLAYDRGAASFSFAPSEALWQRYPVPALVETFSDGGQTLREEGKPLEARLLAASGMVMKRITRLERLRTAQSKVLSRKDGWLAVAFLCVAGAGVIFASVYLARQRKKEAAAAVQYFFPQVEVGTRLGAPHGGGVIAEIEY